MHINSESDWEGKGSSMELSQKKTGDWYDCLTLLVFGFSLLQVFAFQNFHKKKKQLLNKNKITQLIISIMLYDDQI